MRKSRVLPVALLVSLSLGFFLLLARAVYEGLQLGWVSQATLSMLIVVGFLIVAGVAVLASHGRMVDLAARRCPTCGSALYATVRSLDRRRLLTCFTCGHETLTL
ncbi:MAG TPA: hypothetical protein VI818_05655 [Candidatus Thermoplasmatota archaeon]|nr:hypothetical protein [Candidatus Thermoplasmatota archaeon]